MSDDAQVDPHRVARGASIRCPYCGSVAYPEPIAGRSGHRRYLVTCTGLGCHRLRQVVEVEEATGAAVTLGGDARRGRAGHSKGQRANGPALPDRWVRRDGQDAGTLRPALPAVDQLRPAGL